MRLRLFFACCCVAVALAAVILMISSAKDCRRESNGFLEFILSWLCDSDELFALLFISVIGAVILFVR